MCTSSSIRVSLSTLLTFLEPSVRTPVMPSALRLYWLWVAGGRRMFNSLGSPGLTVELSALELSGGTQPAGRTQIPELLTIPSGNKGSGGVGRVVRELIALMTSSLPSALGTGLNRRVLSLSL